MNIKEGHVTFIRLTAQDRISLRHSIPLLRAAQNVYTAIWLASQDRKADLERYAATRDIALEREAGVRIQSKINAEAEENAVDQGRVIELSVPASNDPAVAQIAFEAIRKVLNSSPEVK